MTKLEQAQAIAKMAQAIANSRGEDDVDEFLEDARAAWVGLREYMDIEDMVFYRP